MLKSNVCYVLLILALCVSVTVAQKVYTPAEKSAERSAILNALSVPVSKELKQKITFSITKLKVKDNWAFIDGLPEKFKRRRAELENNQISGIHQKWRFRRRACRTSEKDQRKWRVVTYLMNCHDVCYMEWDKEFKAPKEIIED
jgi:hypothetical protein